MKVCCLEPGAIRTNWGRKAGENPPELLPEYDEMIGTLRKRLAAASERAESDPKKIAAVIVKLANTDTVPKRLILGKDAEVYVKSAETARTEEAAKYRELTLSTVF